MGKKIWNHEYLGVVSSNKKATLERSGVHCSRSPSARRPAFPQCGILLVLLVHLAQCTRWDRARLDSSDKHLVPRRILFGRLRGDQRAHAEVIVPSQRDAALLVLPDQRTALRRGAGRRVRNGDQREEPAEDDRTLARAGVLRERVAGRVCVVPHRGHDQVRAVERNQARLGQQERGLVSWTAGRTQRMVMMMQRIRLNVMKNWLSVHDWPATKPYISPMSMMLIAYIPAVEPKRIHCQRFSEFSRLSRHASVHEWAKSTRRTRPMRIRATQLPQTMKKPLRGATFSGAEYCWKSDR